MYSKKYCLWWSKISFRTRYYTFSQNYAQKKAFKERKVLFLLFPSKTSYDQAETPANQLRLTLAVVVVVVVFSREDHTKHYMFASNDGTCTFCVYIYRAKFLVILFTGLVAKKNRMFKSCRYLPYGAPHLLVQCFWYSIGRLISVEGFWLDKDTSSFTTHVQFMWTAAELFSSKLLRSLDLLLVCLPGQFFVCSATSFSSFTVDFNTRDTLWCLYCKLCNFQRMCTL